LSPAWGWFTGWFNLIGQIAVTAAIDHGAAIFTTALLNLWFPSVVGTGTGTIFVVYSVIIALHLALNLLNVNLLARLNTFSAWWHMIGVVGQFFCGTASVTSASRMMFAFSRDGAVPGSRLWRKVAANRVPVNAVIAIAVLSWALMLATLANGRSATSSEPVSPRASRAPPTSTGTWSTTPRSLWALRSSCSEGSWGRSVRRAATRS
jgi:amino acid transporter